MTRSRRPLRFAVVGLGHFAQEYILPAIAQLDHVELAALVSGTTDKLRVLADRYRVEHAVDYDHFDHLLSDGRIDVAYIAVPNDLHADFTIRAARHGVHVLCEKPMAPTEDECIAMMRACQRAGVKLMIAYRLHFEAANLHAIELARDGQIGSPRLFSSTFSMQIRPGNTRVQPRAGAGPLYDIGIYCINASRYLFRREPYEVVAMALPHRVDPRFRVTDEAIAATLRFPDDRVAQFVASYGAADSARYELIGTDGTLVLDHAYDLVETMKLELIRDGRTRTRTYRRRDQVGAEVEYFARCIREDLEPEPSAEEGLADIRIIEAIARSARTGRAIAIDSTERSRRPEPEQAVRVSMHGKPKLVDVQPPSRE